MSTFSLEHLRHCYVVFLKYGGEVRLQHDQLIVAIPYKAVNKRMVWVLGTGKGVSAK